jgi:hypothetical protein
MQGCPFQAPRAWTASPPDASTYSGVPTQGSQSLCRLRNNPHYFLAGYGTTPQHQIWDVNSRRNPTAQFLLIQRFNCAYIACLSRIVRQFPLAQYPSFKARATGAAGFFGVLRMLARSPW